MDKQHTTDSPVNPVNWDRDEVGFYSQERKKRTRKRGIVVGITVLVSMVAVVAVAVFAWAFSVQQALNSGVDDRLRNSLVDTMGVDDPFYMLLLGVDKNQDRAASEEYGEDDSNYRSDSIILARIDPLNKQVTLVSLHRDLLIDMGEYGENKLNSAYSLGGPSYVVDVVSELAGVPISHYAEVDFDEFDALVDSLGGIEVDVPMAIDDPLAGEPLEAGPQTLNGAQALTLCRSRHAYDDYGDGDVFRAANQRMVIAAIAKKIMAVDPATMASTITQLANMVTTDLDLTELIHLADEMRGIDLESNVYSGITPTTSLFANETWYELLDADDWKLMMVRVNQGLSPLSDASEDPTAGLAGSDTVNIKNGDGEENVDSLTLDTKAADANDASVLILNGAGVDGLAGRVASTLQQQGFETSTGTADTFYETSIVAYMNPEQQQAAEAVAQALGGQISVEDGQGVYVADTDADVFVILGIDMADSIDTL